MNEAFFRAFGFSEEDMAALRRLESEALDAYQESEDQEDERAEILKAIDENLARAADLSDYLEALDAEEAECTWPECECLLGEWHGCEEEDEAPAIHIHFTIVAG